MMKISNEFFQKAILKGNKNLGNSFVPAVSEHSISDDSFFSILKGSDHESINKGIARVIFSQVQINSSACGFVKGKSYYDFLSPHITGYYFLRLDIKKFFHNIDIRHVESLLDSIFSKDKEGYIFSPYDIALSAVTHKVTKKCEDEELRDKSILPIGFNSSPIISNIIFRKVDILIQKYCENKRIEYSRYADDMLFSSLDNKFVHSEQFEKEISIFISTLSLRLNNRKRKACENTISLNGYVIQNEKPKKLSFFNVHKSEPVGAIRLSNKKLVVVNKMLFLLRNENPPHIIMKEVFGVTFNKHKFKFTKNAMFFKKYTEDQLQHKIRGYRSYLLSLVTYNNDFPCVDSHDINKYISLVEELNKYIK